MKPYYDEDSITIYHGDCREIDAWDIAGGVMVTDPPYGIDYKSGQAVQAGVFSYDTNDGSILGDKDVSLRDKILERWAPRPALIFASLRAPFPVGWRQALIWDKGDSCGMGDLSIPWKPSHDLIFVLGAGFVGRRTSGVLREKTVSRVSMGRLHPHEKPVGLMRALIVKCPPLAVVVDPFMGSGSTLVAAKAHQRSAIGVERSERYCELAANRLAQGVLDLSA